MKGNGSSADSGHEKGDEEENEEDDSKEKDNVDSIDRTESANTISNPGSPLASKTTTWTLHYFHNDHLGTPQRLTDATGTVTWSARSEAFGKTHVVTDTVNNPLRFPGQYEDPESGLHYNWNRDYDPGIGRYPQSDPIGLQGGINTYAYALSNPLLYSDPSGLVSVCRATATTAGAILGGGLGYTCGCIIGAIVGGGGGTLVAPGIGTVGGAASGCGGGGSWGGAAGAAGGAATGNAIANAVCEDETECSKATKWQLRGATPEPIVDEEEFKKEWVGSAGGSFDICACKDGAINLRTVGQCGTERGGIPTYFRWK